MEGSEPGAIGRMLSDLSAAQRAALEGAVPGEFYCGGEVDAVAAALSALPAGCDAGFAGALEQRTGAQMAALETVSRHLNRNLLENYQEVVRAMSMISELNGALNASADAVRAARSVVAAADREVCGQPAAFFRQVQKRRNLQRVAELVAEVADIAQAVQELSSANSEHDYMRALELCAKPANLSEQLRGLGCVSGLIARLQDMEGSVREAMEKELNEQVSGFDREIYRSVLMGYRAMGTLGDVPGTLQSAFVKRMDEVCERAVESGNFKNAKMFIQMLGGVVDSLHGILEVHLQIVNWHRGETEFDEIRKAVEDIDREIWNCAETNVTNVVVKAPVDKLNFDGFDKILKLANGFVQFGNTLVDLPGVKLNVAIENMTNRYFKMFQMSSLENAKENIESDSWECIPSDDKFEKSILTLAIQDKDSNSSGGMTNISIKSAFPIDLGKTTISCSAVIKLIYQYLSLMKSVPTLAIESFRGIRELTEYYSFSLLYLLFKPLNIKPFDSQITLFPQNLILLGNEESQCLSRIVHRFQELQMSIPSAANVNGSCEAIIQNVVKFTNNIKTIGWYLQSIRSTVEESLPENSLGALRRFYNDIVSNFLIHFPSYSYQFVIPNLVQFNEFEQQIKLVKWNINEAQTEPHYFTRVWYNIAKSFNEMLNKFNIDSVNKDELWISFWKYSNFLLINGYAVQKCTAEGRTSMLSDFRNMSHDLMEFTNKKIQFDTNWVAGYVQLFFLGVSDFKKWVQDNHQKYTCSHIISVIETGLSDDINRQSKKDLRTFVQNIYNNNP